DEREANPPAAGPRSEQAAGRDCLARRLGRGGARRKDRGRRPQRHLRAERSLAPGETLMIRKLKSGEYRLYSRKADPKTGKRRNLGTFKSRQAAETHERAVQFFKRRG